MSPNELLEAKQIEYDAVCLEANAVHDKQAKLHDELSSIIIEVIKAEKLLYGTKFKLSNRSLDAVLKIEAENVSGKTRLFSLLKIAEHNFHWMHNGLSIGHDDGILTITLATDKLHQFIKDFGIKLDRSFLAKSISFNKTKLRKQEDLLHTIDELNSYPKV